MKKIVVTLLIGLTCISSLAAQTEAEQPKKQIKQVYFKISITTPGMVTASHAEGKYWLKSGKKVVAKGEYALKDFSEKKNAVFTAHFPADSVDWNGKGLEWNFNGTVYDGKMKKTYPLGSMNMSTFASPPAGVGFKISISKIGNVSINNQIYDN